MPDLKNSFIYKQWVLDLNSSKSLHWNYSHIFHQCEPGLIYRTYVQSLWSVNPGRAISIVDDNPDNQYRNICSNCGVMTSDEENQVLKATWNILHRPL